MSQVDSHTHAGNRPKLFKWLQENLWKLALGALVAFAGVIVDRFSDEVNAWVRSIFVGGIGGTYTLESFTYPNPGPAELISDTGIVELKDGGGTVFGVTKYSDGYEYKMFGYYRTKFLLISFGGKGLGGGTLALQNDIASGQNPVFWGWRTTVECVGAPNPASYLLECPALMYVQGTRNPAADYSDFFKSDYCHKLTSQNVAELCADLKKRK
jgi:hypothetical protein